MFLEEALFNGRDLIFVLRNTMINTFQIIIVGRQGCFYLISLCEEKTLLNI